MTDAKIANLEGRINAHRELLVEIVTLLLDEGRDLGRDTPAPLTDLSVLDQEEDPGVLPSEAFAEQAQFADEVRSILRDARDRLAARNR